MKNILIAKGYVEKSEENEGLLDVSVASSAIVDRDGEIIDQNGWDLKNFKKNPQLLWAHNIREVKPPLGKVTKIWFEGDGKNKVMKFKAVFDMADEFAKEIYRKIKEGFLNAFSVGFMPLEREGNVYTKTELLEISVVPVPANPQALVEMRSKGMSPMEWKDVLNDVESVEVQENEAIVTPQEEAVEQEDVPNTEEQKPQDDNTDEQEVSDQDDVKTLIKNTLKEMRKEERLKDIDKLHDALRIVYQSVSIALKNIKDIKENQRGGEK